jgi:hypothetical protein
MAILETINDISLRVSNILIQQQQLKTQAVNWENLYREATEVQKKLLEQGTTQSKQNETLITSVEELKLQLSKQKLELEEALTKQTEGSTENEKLKSHIAGITLELQLQKKQEEQQLRLHFGVEKEQEKLKALNEDLQEQLKASQLLNQELQEELQATKISMVEELADASTKLQQKNNLTDELSKIKEKYQIDLSALHSKNSELETQLETFRVENQKISESKKELASINTQKAESIEFLTLQLTELETKISTTPINNPDVYLNSKIEQLTAQIHNLIFENNLIKQIANPIKQNQPVKIAEKASEQPSGSQNQVHFLYAELQESQKAYLRLENQLNQYIEILSERQNMTNLEPDSLNNLQEQNKIVKLAEAIEGNTVTSNLELKQKLNEMIKEVDRCIAKLNS